MIAAVLLVLVACAAPWAFGAAEPLWWGTASAACLVIALPALVAEAWRGPRSDDPPRTFARLAVALPAIALAGLLPIPAALRRVVSPSAAAALADARPGSGDEWLPVSLDPHSTLGAACVAAACAAVFWIVLRAARSERNAQVLRTLLLAGGVALALFGLWHRLFHYDQRAVYWGSWRRELPDVATPFGPYVNRNHFAGAMLLFVGLAAGTALAAAKSGRRAAAVPPALACAAALAALEQTTSRGALVGLFALVLCLVAAVGRHGRLRAAACVLGAATVVVVALACLGLLDDVTVRFHLQPSAREANRFAVQRDALRIFAGNPLLGTGAGTFAAVYPPFQTVDDMRFFSNAHGDWAQFLMETGLLGAAFVALALRRAGRAAASAARDEDPRRWLVIGPLAGCAGVAVHGFFETNLHLPANALLFAATLSLASAASLRRDEA